MEVLGTYLVKGLILALAVGFLIVSSLPEFREWKERRRKEWERCERECDLFKRIFSELEKIAKTRKGLVHVELCDDRRRGWHGAQICVPIGYKGYHQQIVIRDPGGRPPQEVRINTADLVSRTATESVFLLEVAVNLNVEPERRVRLRHIFSSGRSYRLDELDLVLELARQTFARISFEETEAKAG